MIVMGVWAVLCALGWLVFYGRVRRGAAKVRAFEDVVVVDPASWPKVSLIVPAMNEGTTLPAALLSLRALDYPDLEIIVVDDRSADGTGDVIAAAAAVDPRVRGVRIDALPEGWLGKVHAQARGVDVATGSWLLFTDADVIFSRDALRRALSHAEEQQLDQLVIVARGMPPTFLLDVVECSLGTLLHAAAAVSKSKNRVVGSGQFCLVKRRALEKSEGFVWLKMEPADDFALSLVLKRAGAVSTFFVSRADIRWLWYPTFGTMVRGFEKNLFPIATRYRAGPAIFIAAALLLFNVGPFLAPLVWGWPGALPPVVAVLSLVSATVVRRRLSGRRWLVLLLNPLGQILLALVLLRAMIVVLLRGGLIWRDTFYPLAQLRAGQRVRPQRRA